MFSLLPFALLIPLAVWLVLFGVIHELSRRANRGWSLRSSFLLASSGWGSLLVLITEGLSLFKFLTWPGLLVTWSGVLSLVTTLYGYLLRRRKGRLIPSLAALPSDLKFVEWCMLALTGFQVIALALVAFLYPPDNVDAMSYHLSRVMHWQQNQTIANYPTNIERQVQLNPFAEFVLLHLQILSGGDHFANLVQWFAMLSSVLGVSEIARRLGANRTTQLVAALLCATIPLGTLEASSAQNDYVVAFWLVCFVCFGLALLEQPGQGWWAVVAGLASGLALLTKSIAYFYAVPFLILFGLVFLFKQRGRALKPGLIIVSLALLLNAGYFIRNFMLYGSLTGPTEDYVNGLFTPPAFISNLIRNTAAQLLAGEKTDLVNPFSQFTLQGLSWLHNFTGLSPTDYRTTGDTANPFLVAPNYNENFSGNPLHAFLVIGAIAATGLKRPKGVISLYVSALVLGFLSFSYYFLWWGGSSSRLQLPLLVLWCVPVALLLFPNGSKQWWLVLPVLVALHGLNWTFKSDSHSLPGLPQTLALPRSVQYPTFPLPEKDLQDIVNLITLSGCNQVGLSTGENTAEYPLWVMLRNKNFKGIIEHINVSNPSGRYSSANFHPCAVLAETTPPPLRPDRGPPANLPERQVVKGGLDEFVAGFTSYKFSASFYLYLKSGPGR